MSWDFKPKEMPEAIKENKAAVDDDETTLST
eukprot:CAMPEP_0167805980 /NCGR_PEP_ID=MMETSP0111_2-20121227/21532_1 /TAXON_ID=91324 /ORGANISM="Lotharella globosa, Strain CCCM811" /LENGTH=30 /DNA_ID= /DNA_START= /DNA_END= /DNA_ORIENTATION=